MPPFEDPVRSPVDRARQRGRDPRVQRGPPTTAGARGGPLRVRLVVHGTGDVSLIPARSGLGLERIRLGLERARRVCSATTTSRSSTTSARPPGSSTARDAVRVPVRSRALDGLRQAGVTSRQPREQPRVRPGTAGPARPDPEPRAGRHRADQAGASQEEADAHCVHRGEGVDYRPGRDRGGPVIRTRR